MSNEEQKLINQLESITISIQDPDISKNASKTTLKPQLKSSLEDIKMALLHRQSAFISHTPINTFLSLLQVRNESFVGREERGLIVDILGIWKDAINDASSILSMYFESIEMALSRKDTDERLISLLLSVLESALCDALDSEKSLQCDNTILKLLESILPTLIITNHTGIATHFIKILKKALNHNQFHPLESKLKSLQLLSFEENTTVSLIRIYEVLLSSRSIDSAFVCGALDAFGGDYLSLVCVIDCVIAPFSEIVVDKLFGVAEAGIIDGQKGERVIVAKSAICAISRILLEKNNKSATEANQVHQTILEFVKRHKDCILVANEISLLFLSLPMSVIVCEDRDSVAYAISNEYIKIAFFSSAPAAIDTQSLQLQFCSRMNWDLWNRVLAVLEPKNPIQSLLEHPNKDTFTLLLACLLLSRQVLELALKSTRLLEYLNSSQDCVDCGQIIVDGLLESCLGDDDVELRARLIEIKRKQNKKSAAVPALAYLR